MRRHTGTMGDKIEGRSETDRKSENIYSEAKNKTINKIHVLLKIRERWVKDIGVNGLVPVEGKNLTRL